MVRLYVPAAVVTVLIVVLTYFEAVNQDRFSSSAVTAAEFGKRFEKVPKEVGAWVGTDNPVTKETLEMAGAVNHVSRVYVNTKTNAQVALWLVVGHARDICRHTPDICNPSHGIAQQGTTIKQRIEPAGEEPAMFNTARFREENFSTPWKRVFWAWNGNAEGQDQWDAPDSQKQYYGNNPALYKLYFEAPMQAKDEAVDESVAIEFAEEMLPEINRALFPERYGLQTDATEKPKDEAGEGSEADAAPSASTPATEAAEPTATPAAAE